MSLGDTPILSRRPGHPVILASRSPARRAMLASTGLVFTVQDAGVDEDAIKAVMAGADGPRLALELAAAKALAVSRLRPDAWVLGSDQTLDFDGERVSKPATLDEARTRLAAMRSRTHHLHSAAALARDGGLIWSGVDTARMTMRAFSDAFLDAYIASEDEAALLACVGSYRLEGLGAQLFERVEGDYFTVLGLPLWPVLEALRRSGAIAT